MTIRLAKIELRSAHHNYDTVMILTLSLPPIPIPIRCTDATCSEQASYLTYCPARAEQASSNSRFICFAFRSLAS